MYSICFVNVLLLHLCFFYVNAQLTVKNKACGQKQCTEFEYCSKYDLTCEPCTNICTQTNHNFDENRCKTECQNYLQQINNQDLRDEVNKLRSIATISLTLSCILSAIIIIFAIINILKCRKKHNVTLSWIRKKLKLKDKSKTDRTNNTTISVTNASGKPDLRLDMPAIGMQTPSINGNTPSTTTTTLSRRPIEDSTLDYAYDNPVMVSTPSPVSKPHESAL